MSWTSQSEPPESSEVRRQLQKILDSQAFSGAARQQEFLRFVVEELLAGRGADIKETSVAISVYQRPPGYDPRIDSTVRVEASKLRQRLALYYQCAGLGDPIRISIPKGSYQPNIEWMAPTVAHAPAEEPTISAAPLAPAVKKRWGRNAVLLLIAATAIPAALLLWRWPHGVKPLDPSRIEVTRMTPPDSFSTGPTLSKDGRFLIYSSDRETGGALNLWRQSLDGGPPVRLTQSESNHEMPNVSADGSTLVFSSEPNGPLLRIPAAGGEAKPIFDSAGGRDPRFAPYRRSILYWIRTTDGLGQAFYDSQDSGAGPKRLFGDFAHATRPIWSEHGGHVLIMGTWQSNVPEREYDAWVAELREARQGPPQKTGLFDALRKAGLHLKTTTDRDSVYVWDWRDDWLYLTIPLGQSSELFRVRLQPGGVVTGEPQRLTMGAGVVDSARVAPNGGVVFSRSEISFEGHSLSLPENLSKEGLRRVMPDTSGKPFPHPSGAMGIWVTDGSRRKGVFYEKTSEGGQIGKRAISIALLSPDGGTAAFRSNDEPRKQPIFVQPIMGGAARQVCTDCGTPVDWTLDGRHIFYTTGGRPTAIGLLEVSSGQHADLLVHPSHNVYGPRAWLTSTGDGWVAFYVENGPSTRQIMLAPLRGFKPGPVSSWVPLSDGSHWDESPAWSADGKTIYFVNRHDGFNCIMAQRIDPATGLLMGARTVVSHFHSPRQTLMRFNQYPGATSLWATPKHLFFTMDRRTSEIFRINAFDNPSPVAPPRGPISYRINFTTLDGTAPTSASFTYDPHAPSNPFSSFTVTWEGKTFDLTNSANAPTLFHGCNPGSSGTADGHATFAALFGGSVPCTGPIRWEVARVGPFIRIDLYDGGKSYGEPSININSGLPPGTPNVIDTLEGRGAFSVTTVATSPVGVSPSSPVVR
jgi:Tol biopolymer transport system component